MPRKGEGQSGISLGLAGVCEGRALNHLVAAYNFESDAKLH